jgi:hypothetical protein
MAFRVEDSRQYDSIWLEQCSGLIIANAQWSTPNPSSVPFFVEKELDIVDINLNTPDHAISLDQGTRRDGSN